MTLDFFQQFREKQQTFSEKVALQIITEKGKESFTYRQISREIGKIGLFLQRSGIQAGNSVGILMENHPRWGIAFLAVQSAGAVVVPFDILHQTETLAALIQHSECKLLICSEKTFSKLREIQSLLPNPLPVLTTGQTGQEGVHHWDTVLEQTEQAAHLPLVSRGLDESFVIIYTSGTTGNPKGVVLTQRNVYRNVVELLSIVQVSSDDHILSVLPLYHVLALMTNFVIPLCAGARVTYLDVLEAQQIFRTFQEEGITVFVCIPQFYYLVHQRIFQEMARQPFIKKFLFRRLLAVSRFCHRRLGWTPGKLFFAPIHEKLGSRFRLFGVGGARFDPEIAQSFRDLGFTLIEAYGMTETAALATVTPPGSNSMGSVGLPLPHVQIRIDQPDENGIGEVLIRGKNVMKGYWNNLEATAETLNNDWLHSGDLGYLSAKGFLYITGRKKDVIVLSSGKNIFPEELEHFYQVHCPFIKEMCILGVPDDTSSGEQEKLHSVIVPDFSYSKSQQVVNIFNMIRYTLETLSQRLPPYQRVRSFEIRTDPLPRTTTRKIKRFQVQKELAEKIDDSQSRFMEQSRPTTPVEEKIFELIRRAKKVAVVHREMNLELDLRFDSLERVEFLSNVQEGFQVSLSDDAATEIFTVKDLVDAVEKRVSAAGTAGIETRVSWREILTESLQPEETQKVDTILAAQPFVEFIYFLTAKTAYILASLLFRLRVSGREHLPREYPFVICSNHLSFLDVFLLVSSLPYRVIRRLFFLGHSDYFTSPVMSFLGRLVRVIPVDPDRHLRQALRLGAEGLRRNMVLGIFPEGERSIDGRLKPFRKGPAILATELKLAVVPTVIVGTYEAWPRGSNKIRLHPAKVRFGSPLPAPSGHESSDSFNDRLFQAVERLLDEERHSVPRKV